MMCTYSNRSATKVCHPDFLGEEGHNICVLLNEAYEVNFPPFNACCIVYDVGPQTCIGSSKSQGTHHLFL